METAKKIQAGEVEGKIICNKKEAEILTSNLYFKGKVYLCVKWVNNLGNFRIDLFNEYGENAENPTFHNLVLEVPDEPQFKPFDKVLVRWNDASLWRTGFYSHELDGKHCVGGDYYQQCIPYEGNEHLIGTTKEPKNF